MPFEGASLETSLLPMRTSSLFNGETQEPLALPYPIPSKEDARLRRFRSSMAAKVFLYEYMVRAGRGVNSWLDRASGVRILVAMSG